VTLCNESQIDEKESRYWVRKRWVLRCLSEIFGEGMRERERDGMLYWLGLDQRS
jgi:hypothetical protein